MTQPQPQQQPQHQPHRRRIDERTVRLPDFLPLSRRSAPRTSGTPELDTRRIIWLLTAVQFTAGVTLGIVLGNVILTITLGACPRVNTTRTTPAPVGQLAQEVIR